MELTEAQDLILKKLSAARSSRESHMQALRSTPPNDLGEIAAIGVDTNVLKALRRDFTFAEQLFLTLSSNDVVLIAPGQVLVEYWNNHKVFASEDWGGFSSDLTKLTKRLESGTLVGTTEATIRQIKNLVQEISDDLQEEKSADYMEKSTILIESLLETAVSPMVSRPRFLELATVRSASKFPPGFADEKTKSAALGDFFVWSDFLLGALCVTPQANRGKFVWVTNETKPDWKTGNRGNPSLLEEFQYVSGQELSIWSLDELRRLLKTIEARAESEARIAAEELEAKTN